MNTLDLRIVRRTGWATVHLPSSDVPDLSAWASRWGTPVPSRRGGPLVDRLHVRDACDAPALSLSSRHGVGAFPFHTDQAKLTIPPRYLVLRCLQTERPARATLLHPLDRLGLSAAALDALRRAVWVVDGGRGRFTSTLLSSPPALAAEFLRFDPSYMRPAHAHFAEAARPLTDALTARDPIRVVWERGGAVVVDNWRVLHARADRPSAHTGAPEQRVLERVLLAPFA